MANATTYTATAKVLHWLIAALVLTQFAVSTLMPDVRMRMPPNTLVSLHMSLGVTIVVLMAIRLAQRLTHPGPVAIAGTPPWERTLALAIHRAMYLILLVSPFLGWASASAHDVPVMVFDLLTLPALAEPRARWALTAGDVHAYSMWTLLALIALHVLAALYHRWVRRDGLLGRMLPQRT